MAQRLRMEAVLHMTSKAIQVSQKRGPKIQYPRRSLTPAKVITRHPTKRSAIAKEARNKLPILLRPRSVYIATQTKTFPATDRNIRINSRKPVCERFGLKPGENKWTRCRGKWFSAPRSACFRNQNEDT